MYRTSTGELTARIEDAVRRLVERDSLRRRLVELTTQQGDLQRSLDDHAPLLATHHRDVERLERGGLRAFLAMGVGDREERLSRERAAAIAAQARHDELCGIRDRLRADRADVEHRLAACAEADQEYAAAMAEKETFLLERGGAAAANLLANAEDLGRCRAWDVQYREAHHAGHQALTALDVLASEVRAAADASARSLTRDDSFWHIAQARSSIEASRDLAGQAQSWLAAFHRELAEVGGRLPDHGEVIRHMLHSAAPPRMWWSLWDDPGTELRQALRLERAAEEIHVRRSHVAGWLVWLAEQGRALTATIAQHEAARAALIQRAE